MSYIPGSNSRSSNSSSSNSSSSSTSYDTGLARLKTLLCEGVKKAEEVRGKDIVLFIGNLGAGKSTTIAYLMGARFTRVKEKGKFIAKIEDPKGYPSIGHGVAGHTIFPEIFTTPQEIYLCDSGGFFHNKSSEERIAMSVNLELVVKLAHSAKVVVVLKYAELKAMRGSGGFTQLSDLLGKLFKTPSEIAHSLSWIITDTPEGLESNDIVEDLTSEEGMVKYFEDELESLKKSVTDIGSFKFLKAMLGVTSAAKTAAEKANNIDRQLTLVRGMCAPGRISLINLYSDVSRELIPKAFAETPGISSDQFYFESYDGDRAQFKKFIFNRAGQGVELFNEKIKLQKDKEEYERQIIALQMRLRGYNHVENTSTPSGGFETLVKDWVDSFNQELNDHRTLKANNENSIKALKKELSEIDKADLVELNSYTVRERRSKLGWFGYTRKYIKYQDEPFDYVDKKEIRKGELINEEMDKRQGRFFAEYVTDYGEDADAVIRIMVQKRNRRDNVLHIAQNKREIKELNEDNAEIDLKCQKLRKQILEFNNKNVDLEGVRSQKGSLETELRDLREKLAKKEAEIVAHRKKIAEEVPLLRALYEIVTTMEAATLEDSDLVKKFKDLFNVHVMNEQGLAPEPGKGEKESEAVSSSSSSTSSSIPTIISSSSSDSKRKEESETLSSSSTMTSPSSSSSPNLVLHQFPTSGTDLTADASSPALTTSTVSRETSTMTH